MSTTNESQKRRKYNDDEDSVDVKESAGGSDESSSGEEEEEECGSYSTTSTTFVAWLEEDNLCVGELHFANTEHIADALGSDDEDTDFANGKDDNEYFIVCQIKLAPENKTRRVPVPGEDTRYYEMTAHLKPLMYTFKDSFPFRVTKSSSCIVGIPIHGIAEDGTICDTEELISEYGPFLNYNMDDEIRQSLLDELSSLESNNEEPSWKLLTTNDQVVIDGLNAWWKAGEQKTGWDLSKISKEDFTTVSTIHVNDEKKKK